MFTCMYKEKENNICGVTLIDENKVKFVKKEIPKDELIGRISEMFSSLSDPTRLKIIFALSKGELCVCEIGAFVDVSSSAISHQLRLLRNSRLVKYRKEGKMVYYSLDDKHVIRILNNVIEHSKELK